MRGFFKPARCRKAPEKRCRQWCRGAAYGAVQFAWICNTQGKSVQPKAGAYKRKETPGKPGVSEINAAISATIGSGETGIRTLGTREGTPVFKTGAIGRSAISPGRMLRPGVWIVNEFPLAGNSIEQVGNQ